MKMIWRCRCGKRVEKLTDDNFGCCGCSDPVYGPEYFYMTLECADMLDELDKNYDEQHKELAEAKAEIESKNRLIEQMREALKGASKHFDRNYWNVKNDPDFEDLNEIWSNIEAALAAERPRRGNNE